MHICLVAVQHKLKLSFQNPCVLIFLRNIIQCWHCGSQEICNSCKSNKLDLFSLSCANREQLAGCSELIIFLICDFFVVIHDTCDFTTHAVMHVVLLMSVCADELLQGTGGSFTYINAKRRYGKIGSEPKQQKMNSLKGSNAALGMQYLAEFQNSPTTSTP